MVSDQVKTEKVTLSLYLRVKLYWLLNGFPVGDARITKANHQDIVMDGLSEGTD